MMHATVREIVFQQIVKGCRYNQYSDTCALTLIKRLLVLTTKWLHVGIRD